MTAPEIQSGEEICRLLFENRMVSHDGQLGLEAFPTDEILGKGGKSVSLDRIGIIQCPDHIANKLVTYEKPNNGRAKWGFCLSTVSEVHSILSQNGEQVFEVSVDPILNNFPPAPWDLAHAKLLGVDPDRGKGFFRGYRDKLVSAFGRVYRVEF